MKESVKIGLIILTAVVIGAAVGIFVGKRIHPVKMNPLPSYRETVEHLDSLEETQNKIDTIYIKLKENDHNYEKIVDSVLRLTPNESCIFFLEYIASNRERLDSINQVR